MSAKQLDRALHRKNFAFPSIGDTRQDFQTVCLPERAATRKTHPGKMHEAVQEQACPSYVLASLRPKI